MVETRGGEAAGGEPAPSRRRDVEDALDRVRRHTETRLGLDMPPWTGRESGELPMAASPAMPVRTTRSAASAEPPGGEMAPVAEPSVTPVEEPVEEADGDVEAISERLMLTAAQRVEEPPPPADEIPDEDELRALVRSAVRDELRAELRGELGRDLTGIVRRLARQEVNRLLAAREIG